MKKTNLIMKSAVALALAGVSSASFATTSTGSVAAPIKLAYHMFGNGTNSTVDSDDTLIQAPTVQLNVDDAGLANSDTVTLKYTLNKGAVFGSTITNANLVGAAGAGAVAAATPSGANLFIYDGDGYSAATVLSGGQIGDNTVVIQLTKNATMGGEEKMFKFGAYKVKNLQAAGLDTVDNTISVGQEYRNLTHPVTETVTPVQIFIAKRALTATITANGAAALPRIQVASNNQKFTNTVGNAAKSDFDATNDVLILDLGTAQLALDGTVNKEDGNAYDFNGGDSIALSVAGAAGGLAAYAGTGAGVWLETGGCTAPVTVATPGTSYPGTLNNTTGAISFALTGNTAQVTGSYHLCAKANGTTSIAEITTGWAPAYQVTWFNPRYINQPIAGTAFGTVYNNGVTQTVPYMLSGTNTNYTTYLRVQNTSSMAGAVKVSCLKNSVAMLTGDISQNATAWTAASAVATRLGAYQAALFTPAQVAAACGANGAAGGDFSYVRVTGEFPSMDAIEFMFNNQTNVVTQFNTNNLVTGGEGGNN